jgi:hypothetical protein
MGALKKISDIVSGATTLWGFLPATATTTITATFWLVVMAVAGYLQHIPVFWIMMGLPIAGAAIFTWILKFSEWRDKVSASGKLLWQSHFAGDYIKDTQGKATAIENAQVGLAFQITGTFPISIVVDEMHTSFDGEYPLSKPRDTDRTLVNPGNVQMYVDNRIPMNKAPLKELAEATLRFKIRYGHPGREKYPVSGKLKIHCQRNEKAGGYIAMGHSEILT